MPIFTDTKPTIDFSDWIAEKSDNILSGVIRILKVIRENERHFSDLDKEIVFSSLGGIIFDSTKLSTFGYENLDLWNIDLPKEIFDMGAIRLDEYFNAARGLDPKKEMDEKNLSINAVLETIRLAGLCFPHPDVPISHSMKDLADIIIDDLENPRPERRNLFEYIENLSFTEKVELQALMWVGRGDFEPNSWEEAVKYSREKSTGIAYYLMEKRVLARYLSDGLSKLNWQDD